MPLDFHVSIDCGDGLLEPDLHGDFVGNFAFWGCFQSELFIELLEFLAHWIAVVSTQILQFRLFVNVDWDQIIAEDIHLNHLRRLLQVFHKLLECSRDRKLA